MTSHFLHNSSNKNHKSAHEQTRQRQEALPDSHSNTLQDTSKHVKNIDSGVTVIVPAAAPNQSSDARNPWHEAAFLNVGTKLAIERIATFFNGKPNTSIVLGVIDSRSSVFKLSPYNSVIPISTGNTSSTCETISALLKHVKTTWCLINPITAVPTSHLSTEGAIYFGQDQIPKENWAAMTLHGPNEPIFHTKHDNKSAGLPSFPFTGRIFAKTADIQEALQDLEDSQKSDLLNVASILFAKRKVSIRFERWLDVGHEATYADSKLLSISSRFFNSISYNKTKNTILKSSADVSKLKQEGRYYEEVIPPLKRYFPAVINSTSRGEAWELELEYIGYPSLSEVFLYGNIGLNSWQRILDSICRVFDDFYNRDSIHTENACWLYSQKTRERQDELEKILDTETIHPLKKIYDHGFKANNIDFPPIKEAFEVILKLLHPIEMVRRLHIGHGDLCFNNMLVDPIYGTLKLIDPKATVHPSTGVLGLVDSLYDLAKLNHSFTGLYDSIVNNLYRLDDSRDSGIELKIYTPNNYRRIQEMFQDRFLLERVDERVCNLVTANLFLSMLPLHRDDANRMVALAIVGSSLLLKENLTDFQLFK